MLNLDPDQLQIVQTILAEHIPACEVLAFGSRITGKYKHYSDLDIIIVGQTKIERRKLIKLKEAFAESALPFRVDILDWQRLSSEFKKVIEDKKAVKIFP
ncbi:nucleotidyltransferase domain-containing protein [Candidatus Saganbacteria bacterium]|nr:nucleotidyltransferase domain-containing protein [Candidatus Saganbacteria bacterium]